MAGITTHVLDTAKGAEMGAIGDELGLDFLGELPLHSGIRAGGDAGAATSSRWLAFICTWVAVGAYTAVVWSMYKSMVKNFDMTIRKQSR